MSFQRRNGKGMLQAQPTTVSAPAPPPTKAGGRAACACATAIQERIQSGLYQPGSFIPSIRQLAVEFNLDPGTIQRALKSLVQAGSLLPKDRHGYSVVDHRQLPATTRPLFFFSDSSVSVESWERSDQDVLVALHDAAREQHLPLIPMGTGSSDEAQLVGWCAEERLPLCRPYLAPEARPTWVTWSIRAQARIVIGCLELRRSQRSLPPINIKTPVTLQRWIPSPGKIPATP